MMLNTLLRCAGLLKSAGRASATERPQAPIELLEGRTLLSNTYVVFDTDFGSMVLRLDDATAPITVANFRGYVERGDYNGTFFHRASNGTTIPGITFQQGGGFRYVTGQGPVSIPTQAPIVRENTGRLNAARTIAMARTTDPNSATSGFFINTAANPAFDDPNNLYAAFGEIIDGWNAMEQIAALRQINAGGAFQTLPVLNTWVPNTPIDGDDLVVLRTARLSNGSDLTISSFTADASIRPGANVNVRWTVRNAGFAPTSGTWTDRVVLSRNATVGDSDDFVLGEFASDGNALAANATIDREASIALPLDGTLATGNYSIFVITDAGTGTQAETRENNNVTAAASAVLTPSPFALTNTPVSIVSDAQDVPSSGSINNAGRAIVYTLANDRWRATDVQALTNSSAPRLEVETFIDPNTGLLHAVTPSADGLLLYTRAADLSWTVRNLSTSLPAAAVVNSEVTIFVSRDNLVHIAGLAANGELLLFAQTRSGTTLDWSFRNLSTQDLQPQGMTTPSFRGELVSWVTSWNALNIAGLDADGKIQTVWIAPASFTSWRTDDLSAQTGAPALRGGLTVYQTSWDAYNLVGFDQAGNVSATWWLPGFPQWRTDNLTTQFNFPQLKGSRLASYVTPWGGLNIVGQTDAGDLAAYWWAPGLTEWNYAAGFAANPNGLLPAGRFTGITSAAGTTSITNTTADSKIFRYRWSPTTTWVVEDITQSVLG